MTLAPATPPAEAKEARPRTRAEAAIIRARLPHIEQGLAHQVSGFVNALRKEDLEKKPGIAETLDWAAALTGFGLAALDDDLDKVTSSMICLLKTEPDIKAVTREVVSRLAGKAA